MTRSVGQVGSIGFAEIPDFHVAVARRARPSLAESSVLVGGDPSKRGKVVADWTAKVDSVIRARPTRDDGRGKRQR